MTAWEEKDWAFLYSEETPPGTHEAHEFRTEDVFV